MLLLLFAAILGAPIELPGFYGKFNEFDLFGKAERLLRLDVPGFRGCDAGVSALEALFILVYDVYGYYFPASVDG